MCDITYHITTPKPHRVPYHMQEIMDWEYITYIMLYRFPNLCVLGWPIT